MTMKYSLLTVVVGLSWLLASAEADEILIHGRLVQEGADFTVTDDEGQRTQFTDIWKPHKISRALGQERLFWFRVQRAGKAPNFRLRLMEAYEEKPLLGGERTTALQDDFQARLKMKLDLLRDEQAAWRWVPDKVNSSRGPWSRDDNAFTAPTQHTPGQIKPAKPTSVVGRLVSADAGHHPVRPTELRAQNVTITFRDAASAAQAWLEPLPLYAGHAGALTCRWDDSDLHSALLVSQVGTEHQVYGTCFLNGLDGALCFGKKNQPDRAALRTILERGSSIGNHGYTHPAGFTLRSRNRQFWEAMKCRAEWEALGDCPISTVAPPYNAYGDEASVDLWLRAGHHGFINNAGRKIERYGFSDLVSDQVLMVYGTHARGEGRTLEAVRERSGKIWADIHSDRRIWTPNFNQFAAYRLQYKHSGIEKKLDGKSATFTLLRPALVDLNDPTPLTLSVGGVAESVVERVEAAGARVERLEKRATGEKFSSYTFNLGHTPEQFLPQRIGFIENHTNTPTLADVKPDSDLPGLRGIAWYRDGKLRVRIENTTDQPIRDASLTYRIPFGWGSDVMRRSGITVAAGQSVNDALPLTPATDDYDLLRGRAWFCVQVDFRHGDTPVRLHLATAHRAVEVPDATRPAGHFTVIGPVVQTLEKVGAVLDETVAKPFGDKLLEQARAGQLTEWKMHDDGDTYVADFIQVAPVAPNDEHYVPERREQVRWYLARAVLHSESEQTVHLRTSASHLLLNGQPAERQDAATGPFFIAALNKGANEILVATPLAIPNITSAHGFEFRVLAKSDATSEPAKGIRFSRP